MFGSVQSDSVVDPSILHKEAFKSIDDFTS